jgi:hypothetical protein
MSRNEANTRKDLIDRALRMGRKRPTFIEIDLADRIASSGYITLGEGGEQVYVEEYRQRVEAKVLEIVETHSTISGNLWRRMISRIFSPVERIGLILISRRKERNA